MDRLKFTICLLLLTSILSSSSACGAPASLILADPIHDVSEENNTNSSISYLPLIDISGAEYLINSTSNEMMVRVVFQDTPVENESTSYDVEYTFKIQPNRMDNYLLHIAFLSGINYGYTWQLQVIKNNQSEFVMVDQMNSSITDNALVWNFTAPEDFDLHFILEESTTFEADILAQFYDFDTETGYQDRLQDTYVPETTSSSSLRGFGLLTIFVSLIIIKMKGRKNP